MVPGSPSSGEKDGESLQFAVGALIGGLRQACPSPAPPCPGLPTPEGLGLCWTHLSPLRASLSLSVKWARGSQGPGSCACVFRAALVFLGHLSPALCLQCPAQAAACSEPQLPVRRSLCWSPSHLHLQGLAFGGLGATSVRCWPAGRAEGWPHHPLSRWGTKGLSRAVTLHSSGRPLG